MGFNSGFKGLSEFGAGNGGIVSNQKFQLSGGACGA